MMEMFQNFFLPQQRIQSFTLLQADREIIKKSSINSFVSLFSNHL